MVSNKKKLIIQFAIIILGLIYFVSGFSKAIDVSSFYDTIKDYGFKKGSLLAPLIVVFEVGLAIAFILKIKIRKTALLSSITLVVFTLLFTYAYIFNSVEDCGCFGSLGKDIAPKWLYVRNFIMLMLSIWIYISNPIEAEIKGYKLNLFFSMLLIATYLVGFTYKNPIKTTKRKSFDKIEIDFIGKNINETPLKPYAPASKDSTYMMYFFSYTCPHCLNSMENIKQYTKSGFLEKVILIGTGSEISKNKFYNNFEIPFKNYHLEKKGMKKITDKFPTSFFIINDTIKKHYFGTLPVYQLLLDKKFLD